MPVKEVLRHSSLKIDEIYAVELIGGATRVPKLQVTLKVTFYFFSIENCNCVKFCPALLHRQAGVLKKALAEWSLQNDLP